MSKIPSIFLLVLCALSLLISCDPAPEIVPAPEPDPVPAICTHQSRQIIEHTFLMGNSVPLYERCTNCGAVCHVLKREKNTDECFQPARIKESSVNYDADSRTIEYTLLPDDTWTVVLRQDGLIESILRNSFLTEFSYDFQQNVRTETDYNLDGEKTIWQVRTSTIDDNLDLGYIWYNDLGEITQNVAYEYDRNPQGDWIRCIKYNIPDRSTPAGVETRTIDYYSDLEGNLIRIRIVDDHDTEILECYSNDVLYYRQYMNGNTVSKTETYSYNSDRLPEKREVYTSSLVTYEYEWVSTL